MEGRRMGALWFTSGLNSTYWKARSRLVYLPAVVSLFCLKFLPLSVYYVLQIAFASTSPEKVWLKDAIVLTQIRVSDH